MRVGSIVLVAPGLAEDDRRVTGVECQAEVNAALRTILARTGVREIAVIPEGPYVVPFHKAA
jgi:hypothetical protein